MGLYINDNLTRFNQGLLRELKRNRSLKLSKGLSAPESIYTFQGKVFAKRERGAPNSATIWVKNEECLRNFVSEISAPQTASVTGQQ